jgi:predicted DNA binding CopG/RHH family protein
MPKKKKFKEIPKFKNEDEERDFWATADTSEYFDWDKAEEVIFPNLKPTTRKISLRLPEYLLWRIKELANSKDVPYQSLMKIFLAERVEKELRAKFASR